MANKFKYKTSDDFKEDFKRVVSNSFEIILGISNLNTSYGTIYDIIGEAVGKVAEVASYNGIATADAQMIDTATGEDLYRFGTIYQLTLRPAGKSSGVLVLNSSATIGIVSGQQLTDLSGLKYEVSVGGIYANGANVPIRSVDTGTSVNLSQGAVLRWTAPVSFMAPKALVGAGGLTGGVNAEDDEGLRTRILDRIRNPIGGGNWSQLADAAETSSTAVQKAFVYPAYNGPSTEMVSVVRNTTETNKNRDVDTIIVNGTIKPAIQGIIFEGVELRVSTVQNFPVSASIGLSLPSATTSSPPGPGGGWLDGTPFPYSTFNTPAIYAGVYAVTDPNNIQVFSDQSPTAGISKFVYIDSNWTVYHAKVISYNPVPTVISGYNVWSITTDIPLTGIQAGNWLFPDAVNMDVYIKTLLDVFANLGPGQINDNPGLIPYAYRRPYVYDSWFSDLDSNVLKFIVNAGDEVKDVQYLYKSVNSPPTPSDVTLGPYVLTPFNIGFYPL